MGIQGIFPRMKYICIVLIYLYRYTLSYFIGRQCRFEPSCSVYAIEALRTHGTWYGMKLTLNRILKCRPGGGGGYDPVPDKKP